MGTVSVMGDEQVAQLIADLTRRGLSIATAESLTGGGLVARLVDVPGASHVVRGGVCTYAVDTKASVLGVSESRLTLTGPVDEQVARQMAVGVRSLFGASIGLSPTVSRREPCTSRARIRRGWSTASSTWRGIAPRCGRELSTLP